MSRAIEKQRKGALWTFVAVNAVQDVVLLFVNIGASMQSFGRSFITTLDYVKYDAARRYKDVSDGDFGVVLNQPGYFTEAKVGADDDDD